MRDTTDITHGQIHYTDNGYYWFTDGKAFYLDHSCDEWVIGSLEEAKQFLADLDTTIKEVEQLSNTTGEGE